jgi:hypothetical protein
VEGRKEEPGIIAPQKVIIIPRVIKMDANESALKPLKESEFLESEEVEKKSAVDKFYGMMKISRKLADEIIDMEMWD